MVVHIVISERASPVERYAAEELRKYLALLYHLDAPLRDALPTTLDGPAIVVGHPKNHPSLANADWPALSADGFCLKTVRTDPPMLVVAGGSGRGTLFGVYELVERFGVRFLLSGDVLPEQPEPFCLTGFDETIEPSYPIRAMRPMVNVPESAAPWSLVDFTGFIDQMAKLKFNTVATIIQESGPWLDYEFRGVRRPAGDIFYGYRFPIDDDFIGKELFPGRSEFYSPVLAPARNEEERKQLGIGLVRAILAHCKSRDLMSLLIFSFMEPPTALKHQFNEWASLPLPDPDRIKSAIHSSTPVEEFGVNPDYAAWMNVCDPVVRGLTAHRLKALINTYPEADFYHLGVSEHRAGVVDSNEIFRLLDAKYHLSPEFDWEKALQDFASSPFDRERYQNQMKGDLLFLYVLDKILNEENLLGQTVKPDAALGVLGVMPQLAPVVTKMLPNNSSFVEFLDYGTHGTADQIFRILPLLEAKVPTRLEIGIHDDNDMYFPQANVESLERIVKATAHLGMQGYVSALWQIRQSDLSAAYLGRASWPAAPTASEFYRDFFPRLVGAAAAADFEQAYRMLEVADHQVKGSMLYGYAFVLTPYKLKDFIDERAADRDRDKEDIRRIRPQFQAACDRFRDARGKASPGGRPYAEFWMRRAQFAVDWLDLLVACADLGKTLGDRLKPGALLAPVQKQSALTVVDGLLDRSRSLIELIAGDAKHLGDLGQIANLNQHVHRYLKKVRADVAERGLERA